MKVFAREFPDGPIAQQPVAQLPWGHLLQIIQRLKVPAARDFYIRETIVHGWSRAILEIQILLLCKGKNRLVVEYALQGLEHAVSVAEWQTQLTQSLPEELRSSLHNIEEIETKLAQDFGPAKLRKRGK